jgi:uncharacterized membrane protein
MPDTPPAALGGPPPRAATPPSPGAAVMRRLAGWFLNGVAIAAPIAVTIYVVVWVVRTVDGWIGLPWPGAGLAVTIAGFTLFGFLASTLISESLFGLVDRLFERLPLVRLLYTSTKDLFEAFVGEQRRFTVPVLVPVERGGAAMALGFVTKESAEAVGLDGFVAVYLPFSYSVAGRVAFFPAAEVTPVDVDSAEAMAFVVSGGVTELRRRAP